MILTISDVLLNTGIFIALFALAIFLFIRRRRDGRAAEFLSPALSQELKGLAILMVVFSHIGYFLVADHQFLWPLTIFAGVGVNLFLFLSGYGLTVSALNKPLSIGGFYRRRLLKIFIPMWLALVVFFALDFFVAKIGYSWIYVLKSFLGIFTSANLYQDINSPLWYFTFILGCYLLFPLIWSRRRPWLSALILYVVGSSLVYFSPAVLGGVMGLYRVHIIAFPLGVLAAWLAFKFGALKIGAWLRQGWHWLLYGASLAGLLLIFLYTAYHSGIGQAPWREELTSIMTVAAIILLFSLKRFEFRLLYWFGLVSYEIYLWHWPIMYHYDFLYRFLPAWLATALYLIFFLALGYGVSRATGWLTPGKKPVKA